MPIKIPDGLPAAEVLEKENIFVMGEGRATHQDIRPLKVAVLNLMPTKITTETQLIRLLSNTSLQIELTLLYTATHFPTHTPAQHISSFYRNIYDVVDEYFDGLIITGAPVENREFEDIDYWKEMCGIMEWTRSNVFSTMYICWAAQAGLYHFHGVRKRSLDGKCFGIFEHRTLDTLSPLTRGFDEVFFAPHSRHTALVTEDLKNTPVNILAESPEAGPYILAEKNLRRIYVTGHSEYDTETLAGEYFRDKNKGLDIAIPKNYFPSDDPSKAPVNRWRGHANLLFSNWIEHVVYQMTPYNISDIGKMFE